MKSVRLPSMLEIIVLLLLFLAVVFSFQTIFDLPIQLALFISWFLVIALGLRLGFRYQELQDAITKGISNGLEAILILVAVGALIGTWIAGGVVPTLIYYGLEFIHPSIFLLATLIICSITSIATGTSWGTVGTSIHILISNCFNKASFKNSTRFKSTLSPPYIQPATVNIMLVIM
ncbi:Na+/H+ antiporter NhaC family protein [Bacillus sp. D-CC]